MLKGWFGASPKASVACTGVAVARVFAHSSLFAVLWVGSTVSVSAFGQAHLKVPKLITRVREAAEAMEVPRAIGPSSRKVLGSKSDSKIPSPAPQSSDKITLNLQDQEQDSSVSLQAKSLAKPASLEESALMLGSLATELRNNHTESAQELFARVIPQTLPQDWQGIYAFLAAQVARNSQLPSTALSYMEMAGRSSRSTFEFEERIARESFVDAVNAKLFGQARTIFSQYYSFFDREFLPKEVENAMLVLALNVNESGDTQMAKDLLRRIVKNYPLGESAREAYNKYSELFCKNGDTDDLWGDAEGKRLHARNMIRRVGPLPDVREFALAMSGLSAANLVPKKPVETFSLEEKAEFLSSAEFLLTLREYDLAVQLTAFLKNAQTFGKGFEQDRILFLYARTLNSAQKPELAAVNYKAVFTKFPRSRFAKQAKQRYILSLQYAHKYKEVASETRALYSRFSRNRETQWRTFWAEYLAGDNKAAMSDAAHVTDPDDKARAQYWMARILERSGKTTEAKKAYNTLQDKGANSHYSVLSRWRVALNERKNETATTRLAARSAMVSFEKFGNIISREVPEEFKPLRIIVDSGLGEFAREKIGTQIRKERRTDNLLALSRLAFYAGDFKNASLVPRRNFKAVSQIPSSALDLKAALKNDRELWQLSFPAAYAPILDEATSEIDVSPYLVLGIMRAESNYDPRALSGVGARGLMQIMPLTGHKIARLVGYEQFEPNELNKPEINIAFGAWYLKRLSTYYKGNVVLAIAAYNAGPEAVDRWIAQNPDMELDEFIENIPFDQTRTYVGKVLLNMEMYSRLYSGRGQGLELKLGNKLPQPTIGMEMF